MSDNDDLERADKRPVPEAPAKALDRPLMGRQGRLREDAPETFTDESFQRLAEAHAIPEKKQIEVRARLEAQADHYHYALETERSAPMKTRERQAQFERIETLSDDVVAAVEGLDQDLARAFWSSELKVDAELARRAEGEGPDAAMADALLRLPPEMLLGAVRLLGRYGHHARLSQKPQKRGARKDQDVLGLIAGLAHIWKRDFGRPFTRDFQGNEPVSAAARFCVDVCQIVDPAIRKESINTQMRSVIQSRQG